MHRPSTHCPLPTHSLGHFWMLQSSPVKCWKHTHFPSTQRPLSLQSSGHACWLQSSPVKPWWHTHLPSTHRPLSLHSSGQEDTEQSGPSHPGLQRQLQVCCWYVPWPLQSEPTPWDTKWKLSIFRVRFAIFKIIKSPFFIPGRIYSRTPVPVEH